MCNEKLPLLWKMSKSNHRRCFTKKVSLKISQNSQENTCARVSFSIKLLKRLSLKKRTWHRCFPVKFAKYLRTPFLQKPLNEVTWLGYLSILLMSLRSWSTFKIARKFLNFLFFLFIYFFGLDWII